MNRYVGDFTPGKTIRLAFNTNKADGTPITLAGTPVVSVYKDGSTTESTAGVTLTVDFDSRTGMHLAVIDTSADGTFYAAGSDFRAVITTGTVDSISVVGSLIGGFSLANRSALRPTTADRTLDVSSGGEAGIDWANVGTPTSTVSLSNTTISTTQGIASVSGAVGSVTGGVGGSVSGSVASVVSGVTVTTNNDKTGYALSGTQTFNVTGNITGNITGNLSGSVGSVTGNVGGNVTGSVGSVATGGIAAASFAAGAIDAAAIATDALGALELAAGAASEIAAAVWDLATSGHTTSGTFGAAMNAAGAAGDPWSTTLPGAYAVGTGGWIVGTYLNASVASRSNHSASDIWVVGTRTLTSGLNIALAKGTGITGFNDIAATDVWAAATRTITGGTITTYTGNTPQTGDAYARIGSAGAGLTAIGDTRLANLDAAVSTRSTYAGGDTAGTTSLLSRLTSTRAGYLDNLTNLDAAVSTRLATAGYTAPSTPPTAAAIAAAVRDVDNAAPAAGSFGAAVNAIPTATAPTTAQIADRVLGRNVAGGSDGGRTVSEALYALRNRVDLATGKVYMPDDVTESWTFTKTTDAAAVPITGIDPT